MVIHKYTSRLNKLLVVGILSISLLGLSSCGQPEPVIGEASVYSPDEQSVIGDASSYEANTGDDAASYSANDQADEAIENAATPDTDANKGAATTEPSGALHVNGTRLYDADNNIVELHGVSTHGIGVYPEYVNYDAFRTLRDDWGANVIRLAMYTQVENGYLTGGDQAAQRQLIDDGVKYATDLGMYVIIDWHILTDGNPNQHKSEAITFFNEMSSKYADHTNVIYEICNEPQNSPWDSVIKPYAEEVIPVIRNNDDDAIIIVGTNTWSQDVDAVIGNQIDDPNVMYAVHFYAASHGDYLREKVKKALDAGVPVFISECSICDASGNGGIDYDSADKWLSLIEDNDIPYVVWNLSNKNESSAVIQPGCSKLSDWSENELSETGKWFRSRMRK